LFTIWIQKNLIIFYSLKEEFLNYSSLENYRHHKGVIAYLFLNHISDLETCCNYFTAEELSLYPNPRRREVIISMPGEMEAVNFRILDITGRVLIEGLSNRRNPILELDVRDIQAGIYIFEVFTSKKVLRKRFIKI